MNPHKARVIFFPIKNPTEKLQKLVGAARYHFSKKEHILIKAPDQRASEYVDELLWSMPPHGFLPHVIANSLSSDFVVITQEKENLNHAKYIFNLCPTPVLFDESYKLIYELEDLTTPSRQMLSRKRYEAYKNAHYVIESR